MDDEAHAEIKYSQNYGRAEQKGLRNKLRNEFTAIRDVESIYSELKAKESPCNKSCLDKLSSYFRGLLKKIVGN